MGPKTPVAHSSELFRQPLCEMLNAKHPLVKLADVIDWEEIERSFGAHFQATTGRPALSPRLVAGLLYLQLSLTGLMGPPMIALNGASLG